MFTGSKADYFQKPSRFRRNTRRVTSENVGAHLYSLEAFTYIH